MELGKFHPVPEFRKKIINFHGSHFVRECDFWETASGDESDYNAPTNWIVWAVAL